MDGTAVATLVPEQELSTVLAGQAFGILPNILPIVRRP
jgi:hypothetical protein